MADLADFCDQFHRLSAGAYPNFRFTFLEGVEKACFVHADAVAQGLEPRVRREIDSVSVGRLACHQNVPAFALGR